MRAASIQAWLAAAMAACSGEPTAPPGPCDAYAGAPDVQAYCLSRVALAIDDPVRAKVVCDSLGNVASAGCRKAWVERRLGDAQVVPDREALLVLCGDLPDCAFQIVEAAPAPEVLEQVEACERWTGPYVEDCVGHSLQRWAMHAPTEPDIQRVIDRCRSHPKPLGDFVALARYCGGRRLPPDPTYRDGREAGCPDVAGALEACIAQLRSPTKPQCGYPNGVPPPPP